ncbi:MAG: hypothetical protein JXR36_16720 [Bacteroidales bacterium]|nr:hypothetical protein [Bacteroidales bacterium]
MKKFILIFVFAIIASFTSFSQVTKADLTKAMAELNITEASFESLGFNNLHSFYTDGTNKKISNVYKKVNGEWTNKVYFADNGVVLESAKNGVETSRQFFPYTNISYFEMTTTGFYITLKN